MRTLDYTPRYRWDERLGVARGTVERVVHGSLAWTQCQLGLMHPDAYRTEVARDLGLGQEEIAHLMQDYFSADVLDDGLVDYLRQLRAEGHAVALLSNDSVELLDKLRALRIVDLFKPLVISAFIGAVKPQVFAYQAALRALDRPAEETVFVDDNPVNVSAASALGIHAVRYHAGMDVPAALAPLLQA